MDRPNFQQIELIPAIVQNDDDGKVLMLAYMNAEAYEETLRTRKACFYSRSRQKLWRKGESSGHVQHVKHIYYDCDADTILLKVDQVGGAACHEGYESCFFREVDFESGQPKVIAEKVFDPKTVYGSK